MSCSIKIPKNGLYLDSTDFPGWHDYMALLLSASGDYASQCVIEALRNNGGGEDFDNIPVRNITFVVTEKCNLRCTYCYESHDAHENGRTMSKEAAKGIIDALFEKEKLINYFDNETHPVAILDLIGGEPFLNVEVMDYIVDYFRAKAFELNHPWFWYHKISISSNGIGYFRPEVQAFLEKNKNNVSCGISIDGNKELHDACRLTPNGKGSYDMAIAAWKDTIEKGYSSGTKFTLLKILLMYIMEF
jgi:uncharacterized protein